MPAPPSNACNLCGGATGGDPAAPRCGACGSAPRQRIARRLFGCLPIGLLDWRGAEVNGVVPDIAPHWFQAGTPGAARDFAALVLPAGGEGALAAAFAGLSARGVLYVTRAWHDDGATPGALQDGLAALVAGVPAAGYLAVELPDPCGPRRLPAWLAFRDDADRAAWQRAVLAWDSEARVLAAWPDGRTEDVSPASPFAPLRTELRAWQAVGRDCLLWWRDDDLVADSVALRRLAALAQRYRAPVMMAVIPALADAGLGAAIDGLAPAPLHCCQHGWQHANHEPEGAPKSEFGGARPAEAALADVARGAALLRERLGRRFLPVFVPPWNGIASEVAAGLPAIGLAGLSRYVGMAPLALEGVACVDAHIDIVDWGARGGVRDPAELVQRLVELLEGCRTGIAAGPVGILSHHRAMAEGTWHFMEQLLAVLETSLCVRWQHPRQVFGLPAEEEPCAA